ncbi:MAG: DUF3634 family protein [Planctomycetota bacterium]|jgi:hypothetical protein
MVILVKLLIVAAAVTVAVVFLCPKPRFVIQVAAGKVCIKSSRVPKKFLDDCQNLICECNVQKATIKGVSKSGRVSLRFSREIPNEYHQRFRNVWKLHT